ncbi:MAG: hypothetical protein ACOVNQ_18455, partial [Pirellula sp.]
EVHIEPWLTAQRSVPATFGTTILDSCWRTLASSIQGFCLFWIQFCICNRIKDPQQLPIEAKVQ